MVLQTWQLAYRVGGDSLSQDLVEKLVLAESDAWRELLVWISDHPPATREQAAILEQTMIQACRLTDEPWRAEQFADLVDTIATCYRGFHGRWAANYLLLLWLAKIGTPAAIDQLVTLWLELPPDHSLQVALMCRPLLEPKRQAALLRLFPRLLGGIGHLPSAAIILDLANYVHRKKLVEEHPAHARRQDLAALLGHLARHLEYLEEKGMEGMTHQQRRKLVDDCVSLGVALCHALALIGDPRLANKLYPVLELSHRRMRLEAAYALACLGESRGRETLVSMAADPATRLRALAYADELDLSDQIAPEYRTDLARAEAELASFLAEPTQMGMAPHELELLCHRQLYWPGYAEPVDCWLFRFTYRFGRGDYTNIGIAGPITHAFAADLTGLSIDDLFAVYAGWDVEHEEIFQKEVGRLSGTAKHAADRLAERLLQEGYSQVEPLRLGYFFGDQVLIARANYEDRRGIAAVDWQTVLWWPTLNGLGSLGPDEVFSLYTGRKLLAAFNAGVADSTEDAS